MATSRKIRVLIIDDSALMRQILSDMLSTDPAIEVMATAGDPYIAAKKIKQSLPDIITLDVEMPKMDGLTFLKALMSQKPIPVIVLSSLTDKSSATALKAFEYGALDVMKKPTLKALRDSDSPLRQHLIDLIKSATHARIKKYSKPGSPTPPSKALLPALGSATAPKSLLKTTENIVLIGASTGGTEAIKKILMALPYDCPALVIVQHMPEQFTKSFADRLNEQCLITVRQAEDQDTLLRGHAFIAPGNKHTLIKRSGARYYVEVINGSPVNRHMPSIDVLFDSAASYAGRNCLGILLTGMGKDGAQGLLKLKESGAETIAQDEVSSVVFGMPKEAIRLGAAIKIEHLDHIAAQINAYSLNNG